MVFIGTYLPKSSSLWEAPSAYGTAAPQKEEDLLLTSEEDKWLCKSILKGTEKPKSKIDKNNKRFDTAGILNYIDVKEPTCPSAWQLNKINEGGFASIYGVELFFWYVYSTEGNEFMSLSKDDMRSDKNLNHRPVVIKK